MSSRSDRAKARQERMDRRISRLSMSSPFIRRPQPQVPGTPGRNQSSTAPPSSVPSNPPSTASSSSTSYNTPQPPPPRRNRNPAPGTLPESLDFVITEVFDFAADSILSLALAHIGVENLLDLLSLTSAEVDSLVYPDPQPHDVEGNAVDDIIRDVPRPLKAVLKGFLGYIVYREDVRQEPLTIHNCMTTLTYDDFYEYRCSKHFQIFNNSSSGQPIIPSPVQTPKRTPAEEFIRSIKLDPTYYPVLKVDKGFDVFNRALVATARSHGILYVLDPTYEPQTPEEIELFECHQAFLYKVFASNLLTTKGKELVRTYEEQYDAQSIYEALKEYHRISEKASGDKKALLFFINNNQLTDDTWFDTHDNYITHWNDQVRLYHDMGAARISEENLINHLSNAVSLQPHLATVQSTFDTIQAAGGTQGELTYLAYRNLLHAAAQRYNLTHKPRRNGGRNSTRRVHLHDTTDYTLEELTGNFDNYNTPYDLDMSFDNSYEAYRAFQSRPRLPNARWQQLSEEGRRLWHQFPDDAKEAILGSTAKPAPSLPPPAPPRQAQAHHLFDCERMGRDTDSSTLTTEPTNGEVETDPSNTLLAYATSQKTLPPGNLQRLMSNKMAKTPAATRPATQSINTGPSASPKIGNVSVKKHEVLIDDDGNIYRINNVNVT